MMKNALVKGMLLFVGSAGLAACAPAVPASPTWEHDVRPLLVARCIRCHDSPPHIDPLAQGMYGPLPLSKVPALHNFNFQRFEDIDTTSLAGITPAARYARGEVAGLRMPPPPAEELEDWQIEILDNWAKNPR